MFDPWTMLRNWVHRGGPWTGSKEVVHGPGPKGWSMDLGSMFCTRPFQNEIDETHQTLYPVLKEAFLKSIN